MDPRERIDPDPLTLLLAVMSGASLAIAAANYARTHVKPAPSRLRKEVLGFLEELEDKTRHLRANLSTLKEIFGRADYASPGAIRMGTNAYLPASDFSTYERVSDDTYRRLRELNRAGVRLEKVVARLSTVQTQSTTNKLGDAYARLERMIDARKLSSKQSWSELEELLALVESAIQEVREQLGGSGPPG